MSFFHWKTVWWGICAGTAAVVAATGWDQAWANLCFTVAYLAVGVASVALIGTVLKTLAKKWPQIRRRMREERKPVWKAELKVWGFSFIATVVLAMFGFALAFVVYMLQQRYYLNQSEGTLYPASDPIPLHRCGELKDGQIAIFTGANISIPAKFPVTILRVKGENRFVINRGDDGAILITLDIFDSRGILVARIEDGRFKVLPHYLWEFSRKDHSTLELKDFQRNQILRIRYLNKQAILIDAVLRYPDVKSPIVIDGSRSILFTGSSIEFGDNCSTSRTLLSLE